MEKFDQEVPSPLPGEGVNPARPAEPERTAWTERTSKGERPDPFQVAADELADGRRLRPREPTMHSNTLADPKHLEVGPQPETDSQPEPPRHR